MQRISYKFGKLISGLVMIILTGCASIIDGTTQKITVETPPVRGAKCVLSNDRGKWQINETPGWVIVHKSSDYLTVSCQKKGYSIHEVDVTAKSSRAVYANYVFPLGMVADTSDGAAYHYPDVVTVPMQLAQN